jgi:hypothetical protein
MDNNVLQSTELKYGYCHHCGQAYEVKPGLAISHVCPAGNTINTDIIKKLDTIVYILERIQDDLETIRMRS